MLRTLADRGRACRTSTGRASSASSGARPTSLPSCGGSSTSRSGEIYQGTRLRPDYPVVPVPGRSREPPRAARAGRRSNGSWPRSARGRAARRSATCRDYLESTVGPTLTELAFEGFNLKFWGRRLEDMPAEWGKLRRLERIAEVGDFRLPSLAPHYYPAGGFNPLFEQLLDGFDVRAGVRRARGSQRDGDRPAVVHRRRSASRPTS